MPLSISGVYPVGQPGALADERVSTVLSKELESVEPLAFGAPVFRGTRDHTCSGTLATTGFLGLSVLDEMERPGPGNAYITGNTVGILIEGPIWVTAARSCSPGQAVYFDASGRITNDGGTVIPGARFETTATAGKPVLVWIG